MADKSLSEAQAIGHAGSQCLALALASCPVALRTGNLGAADIALLEIIEEKMSFDMPEIIKLTRPTGRNRKKPQHWAKN